MASSTTCIVLVVGPCNDISEDPTRFSRILTAGIKSWSHFNEPDAIDQLHQLVAGTPSVQKASNSIDTCLEWPGDQLTVRALLNPSLRTLAEQLAAAQSRYTLRRIVYSGPLCEPTSSTVKSAPAWRLRNANLTSSRLGQLAGDGASVAAPILDSNSIDDDGDAVLAEFSSSLVSQAVSASASSMPPPAAASAAGSINSDRRPAVYLFPEAESASLCLCVDGYCLVSGLGVGSSPCAWRFLAWLTRVDALLLTHWSESAGLGALLSHLDSQANGGGPKLQACLIPGKPPAVDQTAAAVYNLMRSFNNGSGLHVQDALLGGGKPADPLTVYSMIGRGSLSLYSLPIVEQQQQAKKASKLAPAAATSKDSFVGLLVWQPPSRRDADADAAAATAAGSWSRVLLPGAATHSQVLQALDRDAKTIDCLRRPVYTGPQAATETATKKPASAATKKPASVPSVSRPKPTAAAVKPASANAAQSTKPASKPASAATSKSSKSPSPAPTSAAAAAAPKKAASSAKRVAPVAAVAAKPAAPKAPKAAPAPAMSKTGPAARPKTTAEAAPPKAATAAKASATVAPKSKTAAPKPKPEPSAPKAKAASPGPKVKAAPAPAPPSKATSSLGTAGSKAKETAAKKKAPGVALPTEKKTVDSPASVEIEAPKAEAVELAKPCEIAGLAVGGETDTTNEIVEAVQEEQKSHEILEAADEEEQKSHEIVEAADDEEQKSHEIVEAADEEEQKSHEILEAADEEEKSQEILEAEDEEEKSQEINESGDGYEEEQKSHEIVEAGDEEEQGSHELTDDYNDDEQKSREITEDVNEEEQESNQILDTEDQRPFESSETNDVDELGSRDDYAEKLEQEMRGDQSINSQNSQNLLGLDDHAHEGLGDFEKDHSPNIFGGESQKPQDMFGDESQKPQDMFGDESQKPQDMLGDESQKPQDPQDMFSGESQKPQDPQDMFGDESQKPQDPQDMFGGESQKPQDLQDMFGGESQKPQDIFSNGNNGNDHSDAIQTMRPRYHSSQSGDGASANDDVPADDDDDEDDQLGTEDVDDIVWRGAPVQQPNPEPSTTSSVDYLAGGDDGHKLPECQQPASLGTGLDEARPVSGEFGFARDSDDNDSVKHSPAVIGKSFAELDDTNSSLLVAGNANGNGTAASSYLSDSVLRANEDDSATTDADAGAVDDDLAGVGMTDSFYRHGGGGEAEQQQQQQQQQIDPLSDWGHPLGLPAPPPSSGTAAKRPSSAAQQQSSTGPVYWFDLAYIPGRGGPNSVDVEFFSRVRARHYALASCQPDISVLNALLEAKLAAWPAEEACLVPAYDTETMADWLGSNSARLAEANIRVAPAVAGCQVRMGSGDAAGCPGYRVEL